MSPFSRYAAKKPPLLLRLLAERYTRRTMNEFLLNLEKWKSSKSKIFVAEGYDVIITEELGDDVKARYIEIEGNGLLSRATLWESGNLVVEAIDIENGNNVLNEIFEAPEYWQLDDKLNWWLSEIATYEG